MKQVNYNSKSVLFISVFILFSINFILKIFYLGSEPFWYDEIISVKTTLLDFGHIKHEAEWDNNPPFYYYSLWVWAKLFGISEFKIRLLNVIFSSFSVVVLFLLGKNLINYKTGTGAALLFTFSNFEFEYSHEARAYSLVVLLVLISSFLFFRLIEKPSRKNFFLLGLVNFLILYTHYIAALVPFFQLMFMLIFYREKIKYFIWSGLVSIGFVLIRFTKKQFLIILGFNKGEKAFWLEKANFKLLKETWISLLGGEMTAICLSILIVATLAYFIFGKATPQHEKSFIAYSILLGFGSIIILFFLGLFTPVFLDRYLIFTVPFFMLIVSWFIFNSFKIAYVFIFLALGSQLLSFNMRPQKPMDYRLASAVTALLSRNEKPMIIIETKDVAGVFAYYYDRSKFMDYKDLDKNLAINNIYSINSFRELSGLNIKDQKSIVLCQSFVSEQDSKEIFNIFKQYHFVYACDSNIKGVTLSLIQKPGI